MSPNSVGPGPVLRRDTTERSPGRVERYVSLFLSITHLLTSNQVGATLTPLSSQPMVVLVLRRIDFCTISSPLAKYPHPLPAWASPERAARPGSPQGEERDPPDRLRRQTPDPACHAGPKTEDAIVVADAAARLVCSRARSCAWELPSCVESNRIEWKGRRLHLVAPDILALDITHWCMQ